MTDSKISELGAVSEPLESDEYVVNQGGVSKKVNANIAKAFTVAQVAHGIAEFEVIKNVAGVWSAAQADSVVNVGHALCVGVPDADTFIARAPGTGVVKEAAHGLGASGAFLYLSQGTPGLLTTTVPLFGVVQVVGLIVDVDRLMMWSFFWETR